MWTAPWRTIPLRGVDTHLAFCERVCRIGATRKRLLRRRPDYVPVDFDSVLLRPGLERTLEVGERRRAQVGPSSAPLADHDDPNSQVPRRDPTAETVERSADYGGHLLGAADMNQFGSRPRSRVGSPEAPFHPHFHLWRVFTEDQKKKGRLARRQPPVSLFLLLVGPAGIEPVTPTVSR